MLSQINFVFFVDDIGVLRQDVGRRKLPVRYQTIVEIQQFRAPEQTVAGEDDEQLVGGHVESVEGAFYLNNIGSNENVRRLVRAKRGQNAVGVGFYI